MTVKLTAIYCVKCKAKTESRDVRNETLANGRPAVRAICVDCGGGKYSIGLSVPDGGLA